MSYYEFPHTRTYNQDLGWLIAAVKELQAQVKELQEKVAALEEKEV